MVPSFHCASTQYIQDRTVKKQQNTVEKIVLCKTPCQKNKKFIIKAATALNGGLDPFNIKRADLANVATWNKIKIEQCLPSWHFFSQVCESDVRKKAGGGEGEYLCAKKDRE